MKHYPTTSARSEILNHDVATILEHLDGIATLLNACYGSQDPRVERAEEAQAALQRLIWALERQGFSPMTLDGPARVRQIAQMDATAQR